MYPMEKLKHLIIIKCYEMANLDMIHIDDWNVNDEYWRVQDDMLDVWLAAEEEVRGGTIQTFLLCDSFWDVLHSKSVGTEYLDGSLVGWTYDFSNEGWADGSVEEWIYGAYDLERISTDAGKRYRKI